MSWTSIRDTKVQHFNQDIIQTLVSQKGQKYKVCLLGKK